MSRLIWAIAIALAAMLLVPLASASAAAPSLTIGSPAQGSAGKEAPTLFAGSTNEVDDAVIVKIFEGSSTSGPEVTTLESGAPLGGTWSASGVPLPEGVYTARAQQLNAETLETGFSEEVSFIVDATAPSVGLERVASPTRDSTPTFTGTLGVAPGDEHAVSVAVYEGGSAVGTPVASGQASVNGSNWSFTSSSLSDGTYTIVATQEDEASNVGSAGPSTFSIDTTAPVVTLNAGSIAALSNNASPTFTGAAGTLPGDVSTVSVLVHEGSTAAGAVVAKEMVQVASGSWSWTTHLADGTYTVQAIQLDEAGNEGRSNSATFKIDSTPPTLSVTSPKSHEALASSRPTFSGTTNNGSSEPTAVTIEIFSGEAASGSPVQTLEVTRKDASWTTGSTGPRLPNGAYTVRAKELDTAGNVGESPSVTFLIASPSPTVTLDALPRYTNDETPAFAGGAAVSEAKPEVTVNIWHGLSASGELAESVTVPTAGGAWSATVGKALPQGTYTAQAEQPAEPANPAGVSQTTTFVVDTTAPSVTLSAPPTSSGLETVSGMAGVGAGDRRQITVELFAGANLEPDNAYETLTVNSSEGAWSATFAGLGDGEYAVIARQSDEAGNVGTSSPSSFTVTVPPTPPAPPAPPAPSPPSASFTWVPANPAVGQSVSLVSSSTDPSSAIGSFAWDVAGNGQFAAGGPAMMTSFATAGAHAVSLRVTDGNGLSSTVIETVKVLAAAAKLMQPFPIVRIAGSETSFGASVRLLTVQAPLGAKVSITCVGGGCKTKAESRVARASSKTGSRAGAVTLAFGRFERRLRAGALLQIRVTQPGEIGKFTSFAIRRHRLPVRTDACLPPASSKPTACPSS
jgi:hypothetical protein